MATDFCLTCGGRHHLQLHHVAGRHNIPTLVVPVCEDCHLILTNWQYAAGLELHAEAERDPIDVQRALCVGVLHLVQLMQQRDPIAKSEPPGLWQLSARAMSKVLDSLAPPDRPGRWLPDSVVEPHVGRPVENDVSDSEAARIREIAYLVGDLLRRLGDAPPLTAAIWDAALAHPPALTVELATVCTNVAHAGPALGALINDHLDAARRVMLWLLTVEDWTTVSERDLDEARIWIDTGRRILDKVVAAANAAANRRQS